MTKEEQQRKAEGFRTLHKAPPLLVLPNAWDAVSARMYELDGFQAVGTTSAGISATLGFPDGERMSLADNVEAVRRMTRCVDIPVSADLEAGYASTPEGVAESARAALEAGAVGVNLEDGTGDPQSPLYDTSLHADKIRAVREMTKAQCTDLVINARTDVYLTSDDASPGHLKETIQRAEAYRNAGADCIFVPDMGNLDAATIEVLACEINAPLNIIAGEDTPPLAELERIGVARVSFGPRAMRAALALVRKIAREWLQKGTYETMLADALSYAEVNGMFDQRQS